MPRLFFNILEHSSGLDIKACPLVWEKLHFILGQVDFPLHLSDGQVA